MPRPRSSSVSYMALGNSFLFLRGSTDTVIAARTANEDLVDFRPRDTVIRYWRVRKASDIYA